MVRKKDVVEGTPRRSRVWVVILILLGVLGVGGFAGIGGTNLIARSGYDSLVSAETTIGTLIIERLGGKAVPILEGTDLAVLRQGVGWYEFTAMPGDYGNCVIAGHRLGWGQPFAGLATLEIGDEIQISVGETTYVYTVITTATVVAGTDAEVLAGVPYDPERRPTRALLTLTTAASILPSPNRLVVIAELSP